MKPVNLSVRFILGDGEPHSDDFSDSEQSEGTSDSDDDWESRVSSVEEDKCFCDAVSLDNSQDASYSSFLTRSLSSISETNLSGQLMGCRQPSKSDQVPNQNETHILDTKAKSLSSMRHTW